jgi:hypothetical protein
MSEWLFTYAPLIALYISILALIASSLSLGWNVYRDVVLKPRLKVTFGVKAMLREGGDHRLEQAGPPVLWLEGTNHGPGEIVCSGAVAKSYSWIRALFAEFPYSFIVPDDKHPYCSRLPHRVPVGDKVSIIFPFDRESFLRTKFNRIGITDSFGHVHWAPRRELKRARQEYEKEFRALSTDEGNSDVSERGKSSNV